MSEAITRPRGRPELIPSQRKRRVQLYLKESLAAHLEAEDIPAGPERKKVALRRKREFAETVEQAEIQSRII